MGNAREPVVGSGCCPACKARVPGPREGVSEISIVAYYLLKYWGGVSDIAIQHHYYDNPSKEVKDPRTIFSMKLTLQTYDCFYKKNGGETTDTL